MSIKEKAIGLIEGRITKTAWVTAVRAWPGYNFYEIGLQVPDADFSDFKGAAHIKCRVAPLTFRDYTICRWAAASKTCTLMVDAAHQGPGSHWAKQMQKADSLPYVGIETHSCPVTTYPDLFFLGDQSALGHFLALQQLAGADKQIGGAIFMPDKAHQDSFRQHFSGLPLAPVSTIADLYQQLGSVTANGQTLVCLAGNSRLVAGLRRNLRSAGFPGQINAQGFW